MRTTPEEAFTRWVRGQESFKGCTTIEMLELAFHAGAKWAIGELDDRMKDAEPLVGDSIPPIASDHQTCENPPQ